MSNSARPRLTILYQDEALVVIDKPPGLLMHRSPISRDEVFVLQTLRDQLGRRVYPVHRLDRATAGVLLFGLAPAVAQRLVAQFEARSIGKTYLAMARGWIDPAGLIDHPVTDEEGDRVARPARTRYRRLARVELPLPVDRYPTARYSLAAVTPLTGRRQQIRKHVSHHLIGDTTHGNGRQNRFFREHFGIHRLLLLAYALAFDHPLSGNRLTVRAPIDPDWGRMLGLFDMTAHDLPRDTDIVGSTAPG